MPIPPDAGILVVNDLRKYFGAVKALDGVSLYVRKGEVVALLGDNGAGKSTFVKTVVGYHQPDGGKIYFEGREVRFRSPLEARMAGIEVVYQELYLIPDLPVYLNIFLAREVAGRLGWLDKEKMIEEAKKALKELQVELDVNARIENLSGGQRQAVAIARALFRGAKLLLLDEPIANLSATEAAAVIDLIHKAKEKAGVLVIIHDIPQAYEVADRIYLIDRGKILLETEKRKTTPEDIERFIVEMSEKAEKAVE